VEVAPTEVGIATGDCQHGLAEQLRNGRQRHAALDKVARVGVARRVDVEGHHRDSGAGSLNGWPGHIAAEGAASEQELRRRQTGYKPDSRDCLGFAGNPTVGLARTTSSAWPLPSGQNWSAPATVATLSVTGGFGDAARATNNQSVFYSGVGGTALRNLQELDYRAGTTYTSSLPGNLGRAPAAVYVPSPSKWLLFAPLLAGDPSTNDQLGIWATAPPLSPYISYVAPLRGVAQTLAIRSRTVPAAVYSPLLHSVIIAVSNFQTDWGVFGCSLAPDTYGCSGDINICVVSSDTTSGIGNCFRLFLGYATNMYNAGGYGPPALACEDQGTYVRCEVFITGRDGARTLSGWKFTIQLDGTLAAGSISATSGLCGYTTGPVSYASDIGGGHFALAVRARNGRIYVAQKNHIDDAWSGFMLLQSIPYAHLGPIVRTIGSQLNFDVLYAP